MIGSFKGRTLLLTGAAGGIGAAIAADFHARGANVILIDLSAPALQLLCDNSGFAPDRVFTTALDVSDANTLSDAVVKGAEKFGGIDFVVPCAGIMGSGEGLEVADEDWQRAFDVNVTAAFTTVRESVSHLREGGAVVTFSSVAGSRGMAPYPHYSASKGAIIALTKSLATSMAPKTRVNAVAPGMIATRMIASHRHSEGGQRTAAQTPLQRIGQPREVAAVVSFLCSDEASFITGQIIHVNGGVHMPG